MGVGTRFEYLFSRTLVCVTHSINFAIMAHWMAFINDLQGCLESGQLSRHPGPTIGENLLVREG